MNEPEPETFAVEISYTLPEGECDPTNDRDFGERTYTVTTDMEGLGQVLGKMDEVSR